MKHSRSKILFIVDRHGCVRHLTIDYWYIGKQCFFSKIKTSERDTTMSIDHETVCVSYR